MGANNFRIELSEDILQSLCDKNIIAENNQPHWGNVNANLSRALGWLTKCDCAILTAWRSRKLRKENDDNNRELQLKIRSYGYGVSKVRGCNTEIGKPTTRENSFLVFAKELGDKLSTIESLSCLLTMSKIASSINLQVVWKRLI